MFLRIIPLLLTGWLAMPLAAGWQCRWLPKKFANSSKG
jgi:hypothetical protein